MLDAIIEKVKAGENMMEKELENSVSIFVEARYQYQKMAYPKLKDITPPMVSVSLKNIFLSQFVLSKLTCAKFLL